MPGAGGVRGVFFLARDLRDRPPAAWENGGMDAMDEPRGARLLWIGVLAAASLTLIALVVWLVLWPLWLESRMPPAKGVLPDHLPLGVVREGAVVEASARVFVHTTDPTGLRAKVRAPWFVKVEETHVGGPGEGTSRGTVFCDVYFSVKTS